MNDRDGVENMELRCTRCGALIVQGGARAIVPATRPDGTVSDTRFVVMCAQKCEPKTGPEVKRRQLAEVQA